MAFSAKIGARVSRLAVLPSQAMVALVIFLFFVRGLSIVLIYTLIPKLKSLFGLSYTQVMLTQLSFFLGYLFFSVPSANLVARIGYVRAIVWGLALMAGGCLLISPAALLDIYWLFWAALFVMAAGITMLQVADNPFIAVLGSPENTPSRLTLAQAFNALGTTISPLIGAWLILAPAKSEGLQLGGIKLSARFAEEFLLQLPFLVIAAALAVVAIMFWLNRDYPAPKTDDTNTSLIAGFRLLQRPQFALGVISIFVYVGAEVTIGSMLVSYLMQASVLSITASRAGQLVSFYWGGAMCGRFVGSAILRIVPPNIALSLCAALAALLAIASCRSSGSTAAVTVLAIGLCNSIMFPTIFALALRGLGKSMPDGSGILCMAIVGGAVVPLIAGVVADNHGLALALLVPAACYVWIAMYGAFTGRYSSRTLGADLAR